MLNLLAKKVLEIIRKCRLKPEAYHFGLYRRHLLTKDKSLRVEFYKQQKMAISTLTKKLCLCTGRAKIG